MKKSISISEEDSALFREAVSDIKPLKQDVVVHKKSGAHPTPSREQQDNPPDNSPDFYDSEYDQDLLERGDEMFFSKTGLQKQTIRKLRRGQYKIEDELDLHGLTVEKARAELSNFLASCHTHSLRCVSIIHGKGIGSESRKPIIKNKVNNWLKQRKDVLAFCSARPADGGTGAVYVLLKRS